MSLIVHLARDGLNMSQNVSKRVVDVLVVSHFDAHGVATGASVARLLRSRGLKALVRAQYPITGPQGLSNKSILNIVREVEARQIWLIDIPLDVRSPMASIETLREMTQMAQVRFYDHHETDIPYITLLHESGILCQVCSSAVELALILGVLQDELAQVGIVADRDATVVKIVPRETIEAKLLPLANKLDVLVREPKSVGFNSLSELAEALVEYGVQLLESVNVSYPPYELVSVIESNIVAEGSIAMLLDLSNIDQRVSIWLPKTIEVLLQRRNKVLAIFVAPAIDPRTRSIVGYDVRIIRYWLAKDATPEPAELIAPFVINRQVVGHGDYVSVRFTNRDEAMRVANAIFNRVEYRTPTVAHLINDSIVAQAVSRDYERIIELLERIATALERGSVAKERQVELLQELYERDQRTRYD